MKCRPETISLLPGNDEAQLGTRTQLIGNTFEVKNVPNPKGQLVSESPRKILRVVDLRDKVINVLLWVWSLKPMEGYLQPMEQG